MITEDYCSYEVAKLLKEKGFDWMCNSYYTNLGRVFDHFCCHYFADDEHDRVDILTQTLRPTHQMAMKWLREVHNKHCDIGYDIDLGWFFQIIDLKETVEYDYLETKCYHTENEIGFNSYEEAVEAALKYVLENLI